MSETQESKSMDAVSLGAATWAGLIALFIANVVALGSHYLLLNNRIGTLEERTSMFWKDALENHESIKKSVLLNREKFLSEIKELNP